MLRQPCRARGALNHTSPTGISPEEELLPELLAKEGYATGMFGKWHLGLPPYFAPSKNGFQEWLGIPYSNDNTKYHPVLSDSMPPLPLYDGDSVIETDPDQRFLPRGLRIEQSSSSKIIRTALLSLCSSYHAACTNICVRPFRGKSARGLYGDVIEEIDWSVGEIVNTIDRLNLSENTLVIFTMTMVPS